MSRKNTVVEDELKIKGGGIYCICPWEKLDDNNKTIFKIGFTTSFRKRIEQYHTAFILGVYLVAFLQTPTKGRQKGSNGRFNKTITEYYHEIENKLKRIIVANGGKNITSTTRIRNLNGNNEGESEWYYMDENIIRNSFRQIKNDYGGKFGGGFNDIFNLNEINANADKTNKKFNCSVVNSSSSSSSSNNKTKKKKCYKAEIYFPLSN